VHCTALHYTTLHCTALHCTALHCTALHCTTLHYTIMHCTALHRTAPLTEEEQVKIAQRIGLIQHLPTGTFDGCKKNRE
jgi:hypothetical protein